jgi:glycosyltransferase involved in cell wall biosynthesis
VSCFVAETTRQLLELGDRPMEILPNPVDTSAFRPRPEVPEETGLIVFVGTVCEKKGIRQLIHAMPGIAQAAPEAHLLVVGRDWRDRESGRSFTEYLRGLIPADLQERIVFQGAVEHDQLWRILARAAVCVYPSHMEALPVAWVEAMAMGKAVVASNTGPGPEVVEDGVSGLLCNPHQPESIAEKVIQLLKAPQLRRRLGAAARQRAVEHFSVEVLVGRNLDFYHRCVEDWKRDGAAR